MRFHNFRVFLVLFHLIRFFPPFFLRTPCLSPWFVLCYSVKCCKYIGWHRAVSNEMGDTLTQPQTNVIINYRFSWNFRTERKHKNYFQLWCFELFAPLMSVYSVMVKSLMVSCLISSFARSHSRYHYVHVHMCHSLPRSRSAAPASSDFVRS